MESGDVDYGTCCACGKVGDDVKNFLMLNKLAPVPGSGWGCVRCGKAANGALAVVCDGCLAEKRVLRWAISGYADRKGRVAVGDLRGEWRHNMAYHYDEIRKLRAH